MRSAFSIQVQCLKKMYYHMNKEKVLATCTTLPLSLYVHIMSIMEHLDLGVRKVESSYLSRLQNNLLKMTNDSVNSFTKKDKTQGKYP